MTTTDTVTAPTTWSVSTGGTIAATSDTSSYTTTSTATYTNYAAASITCTFTLERDGETQTVDVVVQAVEGEFTTDPSPASGNPGDSATMTCIGSPPPADYIVTSGWLTDGNQPEVGITVQTTSNDTATVSKLVVAYLQSTMTGTYSCYLKYGPSDSISSSEDIIFSGGAYLLSHGIISFPSRSVGVTGGTISITCVGVATVNATTVRWYHNDVVVSANSVNTVTNTYSNFSTSRETTSVLVFPEVTTADEGTVECYMDMAGEIFTTGPKTLHIVSITSQPVDTYITQGSDFKMFCVAEGPPTPVVRWTKDGSAADTSKYSLSVTSDLLESSSDVLEATSVYSLDDASSSDEGDYSCTATWADSADMTGGTETSDTATVYMFGVSSLTDDKTVAVDDALTLTCKVDISPVSTTAVSWKKDGVAASGTSFTSLSSSLGYSTIVADTSAVGKVVYSCAATYTTTSSTKTSEYSYSTVSIIEACSTLSDPTGGTLDCTSSSSYTKTCTVTCDSGYVGRASPRTFTCTDGVWDSTPTPNAECTVVATPAAYVGTFTVSYTLPFSCEESYGPYILAAYPYHAAAAESSMTYVPATVQLDDDSFTCSYSGGKMTFTFKYRQTTSMTNQDPLDTTMDEIIDFVADNSFPVMDDLYGSEVTSAPSCTGFAVATNGVCTTCPQGFYISSDQCEPCPRGTYQMDGSSNQCKTCPVGTSTLDEGATSEELCVAVCEVEQPIYSISSPPHHTIVPEGSPVTVVCDEGFSTPSGEQKVVVPCGEEPICTRIIVTEAPEFVVQDTTLPLSCFVESGEQFVNCDWVVDGVSAGSSAVTQDFDRQICTKSIQVTETTKIECSVTRGNGEILTSASNTVTMLTPTITISTPTISTGDSVQLACSAVVPSGYLGKLVLMRNGQKIGKSTISSDLAALHTHEIDSATVQDAGEYYCHVEYIETGVSISEPVSLTVLGFLIQPSSTTVPHGSVTTLSCSIPNVGTQEILWLDRDGNSLISQETTSDAVILSTLEVDSPGVYDCHAYFESFDMTASATVTFANNGFTTHPVSRTVNSGDSATLQCNHSDPTTTIQWIVNGFVSETTGNTLILDDLTTDQKVKCFAEDASGSYFTQEASVTVRRFLVHPSDTMTASGTATFQCSLYGSDVSVIQWEVLTGSVISQPPYTTLTTPHPLIQQSTLEIQTGEYVRCAANVTGSNHQMKTKWAKHIPYSVRVTEKFAIAKNGFIAHCEIQSQIAPQRIIWRVRTDVVHEERDVIYDDYSGTSQASYYFTTLSDLDVLELTCGAIFSTSLATSPVRSLSPLGITMEPASTATIEGDYAILSCQFYDYPEVTSTISWSVGSLEITDITSTYITESEVLSVAKVTASQLGSHEITCQIEYEGYGFVTSEANYLSVLSETTLTRSASSVGYGDICEIEGRIPVLSQYGVDYHWSVNGVAVKGAPHTIEGEYIVSKLHWPVVMDTTVTLTVARNGDVETVSTTVEAYGIKSMSVDSRPTIGFPTQLICEIDSADTLTHTFWYAGSEVKEATEACSTLSDPTGGTLDCTSSSSYTKTCTVTCDSGYVGRASPRTFTCTDGVWDSTPTPNAECTVVATPAAYVGTFTVSYTLPFSCEESYGPYILAAYPYHAAAAESSMTYVPATVQLDDDSFSCSYSGGKMTFTFKYRQTTSMTNQDPLDTTMEEIIDFVADNSFPVMEYLYDNGRIDSDGALIDSSKRRRRSVTDVYEGPEFSLDASDLYGSEVTSAPSCTGFAVATNGVCTTCPQGFYISSEQCEPCPRGTYQMDGSSNQCKTCPVGTSTLDEGATSEGLCVAVCEVEQPLYSITSPPHHTIVPEGSPVTVVCDEGFTTTSGEQKVVVPCGEEPICTRIIVTEAPEFVVQDTTLPLSCFVESGEQFVNCDWIVDGVSAGSSVVTHDFDRQICTKSLQVTETTKIECSVTRGNGEILTSASNTVTMLTPTITISTPTISTGDSVQLACSAVVPSGYLGKLVLMRNGQKIGKSTISSDLAALHSHEIDSATVQDAGEYYCHVEYIETGVSISEPVSLTVLGFLIQPGSTTVPHGSVTTLSCSIPNVGTQEILWLDRDGNSLTSQETTSDTVILSTLEVDSPGVYDCHGYFESFDMTATATVTFASNGFITHPVSRTVNSGDSATLQCNHSDPTTTIQWIVNGFVSETTGSTLILDDLTTDQKVKCFAEDASGSYFTQEAAITVRRFLVHPSDTMTASGTATFQCSLYGSDVSEIQWEVLTGSVISQPTYTTLTNPHPLIQQSTLEIQTGEYVRCVANVTGSDHQMKTKWAKHIPYSVRVTEKFAIARNGFIAHCEIQSQIAPQRIIWRVRTDVVHEERDVIYDDYSGTSQASYYFTTLSDLDVLELTCGAIFSTSLATSPVRSLSPLGITMEPASTATIEGDYAILSCQFYDYPEVTSTITWSVGSLEITDITSTYITESEVLSVAKVTASQLGSHEITCQIEYEGYGFVTSEANYLSVLSETTLTRSASSVGYGDICEIEGRIPVLSQYGVDYHWSVNGVAVKGAPHTIEGEYIVSNLHWPVVMDTTVTLTVARNGEVETVSTTVEAYGIKSMSVDSRPTIGFPTQLICEIDSADTLTHTKTIRPSLHFLRCLHRVFGTMITSRYEISELGDEDWGYYTCVAQYSNLPMVFQRLPLIPEQACLLPEISNGFFESTFLVSGKIATTECYTTHELSDTTSYLQCIDGELTGVMPVCVPVKDSSKMMLAIVSVCACVVVMAMLVVAIMVRVKKSSVGAGKGFHDDNEQDYPPLPDREPTGLSIMSTSHKERDITSTYITESEVLSVAKVTASQLGSHEITCQIEYEGYGFVTSEANYLSVLSETTLTRSASSVGYGDICEIEGRIPVLSQYGVDYHWSVNGVAVKGAPHTIEGEYIVSNLHWPVVMDTTVTLTVARNGEVETVSTTVEAYGIKSMSVDSRPTIGFPTQLICEIDSADTLTHTFWYAGSEVKEATEVSQNGTMITSRYEISELGDEDWGYYTCVAQYSNLPMVFQRLPLIPEQACLLPEISNGFFESTFLVSGKIATTECYTTHELSDTTSYLQCIDGELTGVMPVCVPVKDSSKMMLAIVSVCACVVVMAMLVVAIMVRVKKSSVGAGKGFHDDNEQDYPPLPDREPTGLSIMSTSHK
eukprot:sb/3460367/